MPNTGPSEGSRRQIIAFLPMWLSASPRPTVVVVLPSPAGVGLIAVTRISLPSGLPFSVLEVVQRDLGLVVAVGLEVSPARCRASPGSSMIALHLRGLRDLDVGERLLMLRGGHCAMIQLKGKRWELRLRPRARPVSAPSPLGGEGMTVSPRTRLGEGYSSPIVFDAKPLAHPLPQGERAQHRTLQLRRKKVTQASRQWRGWRPWPTRRLRPSCRRPAARG